MSSDSFLPTLDLSPRDDLPKDWIPVSCQELPGQELHLTMSVQTELAHHNPYYSSKSGVNPSDFQL